MRIHMVAICGTGMGSLAGLLKEAGHEVRGSDRAFYPPMAERLRSWGIPTFQGFDATHLDPGADVVIVGNACRKDNPEAQAALQQGMRVMSFPQALSEFFITGKQSVVVAGTHGKTTTAALLSFLLMESGLDPSFLVGGIPLNYGRSFHLGKGSLFVVEGDEYDTAFFDKRPKFLHYQPQVLILTAVEFDHADIYSDMDAYRAAFAKLIGLLPANGLLVACTDDPEVRALVGRAACRVLPYGLEPGPGWRAEKILAAGARTSFELVVDGRGAGTVQVPLAGRHNVANTLAALAAADHLGVAPNLAAGKLTGFRNVARRMEVRGVAGGVTVIDDFAHHPTKVRETVRATRARFPSELLVAVFEPRTNSSRRKVFQDEYPRSFAEADWVVIAEPFEGEKVPLEDRFDAAALVAALQAQGKEARFIPTVQEIVEHLTETLPAVAVLLVMSNGAFDNIHERLLEALASKRGQR